MCWAGLHCRELTEGAVHGIGEAISHRELPLRGNHKAKSSNEEKVGDVDVGGRDTAPFHQAERQRRERRRKGANWQCTLGYM